MARRSFPLLAALLLVWLLAGGLAIFWPSGDEWLLVHFYAGDDPRLGRLAEKLTHLGGWAALLLATLAGAATLTMGGQRREAVLLLAIALGGRLLVELQKLAIGRSRPELPHLDLVNSFSFPSGHSANAMITGLALALLLARERWAIAVALAFAVLIGCTRMMLGIHWPSDVLGGWAFGGFWVLAMVGVFGGPSEPIPGRRSHR